MENTQKLTAWLESRQCGGVKKYNPFSVEEHPLIKPAGSQCVEIIHDEWGIELPIGIEEVAELIRTAWPGELGGWKIELTEENAYRFKDLSMFRAVVFYLLARQGGAKKTEAKLLVECCSTWEGECLVESLYDRLRRYYIEAHSCEKLISAYAKIIKDFVDVLPEEKRRRRGGGRTA